MKRLIFAVALLLPIGGWSNDENGYFRPYLMIGKAFNFTTCENFVNARVLGREGHFNAQNQFNQWLDGYLTAYDMFTPDTFDIAAGKDIETLDVWLENYCKQHPYNLFNKAVESLTFELYPTRQKTAP
jgi:hypothetical protein